MCGTWPPRKWSSGPRPLAFDATHWLGGGAADDAGVAVGEFDGEGGVGDVDGDGLPGVGAAEGIKHAAKAGIEKMRGSKADRHLRKTPPSRPRDAVYAPAQMTGLLPDYDKCQAYIADVHSAFRSGS